MMPPFSFSKTESVEPNSGSEASEEGVKYSRNAVAEGPEMLGNGHECSEPGSATFLAYND